MKGNIVLKVVLFLCFLAISNQSCSATCNPTFPNCRSCSLGFCAVCCDKYGFDANGACFPCEHSQCLRCNSPDLASQTCTVCAVGYATDPSNQATCLPVDESKETNCQAVNGCSSTFCLAGNVYALNSANQCLKCNQIYRNCLKCNNAVCLHCQSNFARNTTSGNKQCQLCNMPRCSYCEDGPICKNCISGSYISGGICLTCILPCKNCTSATVCTLCDSSPQLYVLVNSTCHPCRVQMNYCYKCTTTSTSFTCVTCMDGYYLPTAAGSTCQSCDVTCKTCNTLSTNCTSCFGIERVLVSYVCQLCSFSIPNCQNCSSTTTCLKCKDGYALTTGTPICVACNPLHGGCSICDNTKCYVCDVGYTLQSDFKCSMDQCNSPCRLCGLTSTTCVSCVVGHYLSGSTCPSCDPTCKSCSNSSSCMTCAHEHVFSGGSCNLCPTGQMYNPFNYTCALCDISCTKCRWWQGCSICSPLYSLDSTIKPAVCRDICGDGFVLNLPCDNTIGVAHDGCLDDCKIEKDFTCTTNPLTTTMANGTIVPTGQSDCIYTGTISMKIVQARQSLFKNTLTIGFQIKPYLYGMPKDTDTQSYLQSIFKLTPVLSQVTYRVSVDQAKEIVTIQIDHNIDISVVSFTFMVDYPALAATDNMFINLSQQSINFIPYLLSPFGRLGQFQSQQSLQKSNMLYYWSTFLALSGLVIAVFGIFGKVLVGLDQVMLMQTFFVMLAFANKELPLSLQALKGLKYSTGLQFSSNDLRFSQTQSYAVQIETNYFITNFNINLIVYMLPLLGALLFLIYMLKNKHLPSIKEVGRQNYEVLIGESIFYITAFNLNGLIMYSYLFYTYSPYSNDFYSNLAIFFAVVFTIYALFNFFFKSYVVGMFRSAFRSESQQRDTSKYQCVEKYTQCISRRFFNEKLKTFYMIIGVNFYTIYLSYMVISISMLVFLPNISSPIILTIQTVILFLVAFIRPHYSVFQKLRAIVTWVVALFGTIVLMIGSKSFAPSIFFLSLLSLHELISVFVMIISVWEQIKRKCNDRTEAVKKLLKQQDAQNEKNVLKQIILRYQQLQNPTINLSIDNQVHKRQQFYNKSDSSKRLNLLDKEQPMIDASRIPQHLKFENQIIKQEHDHWRYQKGLQFFDKYQGIIDNELVKEEYANIKQFQEQQEDI